MNLLNNRTKIRQLAGSSLLAWVFGLGAGIAHACTVALRLRPSDHASESSAIVAVHHHSEAASHEHARTGSIGNATCVNLCDDTKAAPNLPETCDVLPATTPLQSWALRPRHHELLAAALITARARKRSTRPTLPFAIEFLRLARWLLPGTMLPLRTRAARSNRRSPPIGATDRLWPLTPQPLWT
jgi:hypothetical protein